MSTAFAMAAPASHVSPPCNNLRRFPFSPLNPSTAGCPTATGAAAAAAAGISTATHLSNLERLLEKQKEPSPPPPAPERRSGSRDDSGLDDSHPSFIQKTGSRLLNALNLPSAIFLRRLSKKFTEEMSPGSLDRLHRLLSNSNRASPRGSISRDWRRFHGAKNWDGLLDPLDEDLRRELVRYGEFVQATYHAFHSGGAQPDRPRQVVLSDRNYRVTRNLFATASVELPPWVDTVAPWMAAAQPTSWIGYVAVCENEREIQRMGRRDIVIALRGTSTCLEWAENFRTELVPIDDEDLFAEEDEEEEQQGGVPKVECGFRSLYKTPGWETPSLSSAVAEEVRKLTEEYAGEELSITVVGHSLGAALAVLVADDLAACVPPEVATAVFTFGGPRAGNQAFADRVEARGVKVLRVVNAHDLVTRVPGLGLRSSADGYAHVGRELVVDSRNSPYLRPDANPACCHDLEAYLHLVDGFSGSDCPFRADAKRSLARLLSQQGANMKKVYVSKARDMQLQAAGSFGRCNSDQMASPTTTY